MSPPGPGSAGPPDPHGGYGVPPNPPEGGTYGYPGEPGPPPGGQGQPYGWDQPHGSAAGAGYQAGPYPPPHPYGYGYDPSAPYGRAPNGEPYSEKQKLVAGLLQLFLGGVGAGRWYLGDTGIAVAQLLTCGGLGIWALIDAIMILTGNVRDKYGRPLRD